KYRIEFDMPEYEYKENEGGELVFFWHNGLAPVKAEWGVNFLVDHGINGMVTFYNRELNLSFSFPTSSISDSDRRGLSRLEVFRVAFPKYVERPPHFREAALHVGDVDYPLELTESINKIAFKVLEERMGHEFANALIRVALKKASEYALRNSKDKNEEGLGALLGLFNAITEKADTRNWQTLPHSIYYTRVSLPEGPNTVSFSLDGDHHTDRTFTYQVNKGQMYFHTFTSLESRAPRYY
ncbi:MAG: hypothetical protein ACKOE6_15285, partial [Flammeovirgaceae bacterium]